MDAEQGVVRNFKRGDEVEITVPEGINATGIQAVGIYNDTFTMSQGEHLILDDPIAGDTQGKLWNAHTTGPLESRIYITCLGIDEIKHCHDDSSAQAGTDP